MADIHGVSKVREIAVHDIGYRVVDSSSGNKAADITLLQFKKLPQKFTRIIAHMGK